MLQSKLGKILDTRIRQERRRHGKQIGLTSLENRLRLVLLRWQVPVLDDLGTADGRNRQLLMPLDTCGLGHLGDQRRHPYMEAMTRAQHLKAGRRHLSFFCVDG